MDLEELIRYENENTNLDFKAVPYKKEMFGEMLKDIVAMANADTKDDRFIIIGVKHFPDGSRSVLGVDEFVDDASYQKLVNDNVEPDLNFEYASIDYEDKKISYFRIYNCNNQPYMLKKDFGPSLKRGDSFVRKGSFQTRLVRKDIDRMISSKSVSYEFDDKLQLSAVCNNSEEYLQESVVFVLPSMAVKNKIERIIKEKEEGDYSNPLKGLYTMSTPALFGGTQPYENRDITTLREDLSKVSKTYAKDDAYSLFEKFANKLNLTLYSEADRYIEDASVEVVMHAEFDFMVSDKIYKKPHHNDFLSLPSPASWEELNYPNVEQIDGKYRIFSGLNQLKHSIKSNIFRVPIRIFIPHGSAGKHLMVDIKIFGKNLPVPIVKSIAIDVLKAS